MHSFASGRSEPRSGAIHSICDLRTRWTAIGTRGTQVGNPDGNTPSDYVAAWRHVHDIFTQVGATNVRWVWSPNIIFPTSTPYASIYPGDGYVDWVALDGYNSGTVGSGPWRNLATLFEPSYVQLAALTAKPMMIAEVASSEIGGNKAAWIVDAFTHDLPQQLPRIRAVIWFDDDKEQSWSVTSSQGALLAYRNVVSLPRYRGSLP